MNYNNTLSITLGAMGSGKTTSLIQTANKFADFGYNVLIIGPVSDTRSNNVISSHNSNINLTNSKIKYVSTNKLSNVSLGSARHVFIDEGHFLIDLHETCVDWFINKGVNLWIYGLDGDCEQKAIGSILSLIPYVNGDLVKLKSVCRRCIDLERSFKDSLADYTVIKGDDDRIGQYKVGGFETYEAVCLEHMRKLKWNQQ
jgi:thymidine kinase